MTKEIDTTRLRHEDTRKVDLLGGFASNFKVSFKWYIISAWCSSGIWVYNSDHSKKGYFIIHPTYIHVSYTYISISIHTHIRSKSGWQTLKAFAKCDKLWYDQPQSHSDDAWHPESPGPGPSCQSPPDIPRSQSYWSGWCSDGPQGCLRIWEKKHTVSLGNPKNP